MTTTTELNSLQRERAVFYQAMRERLDAGASLTISTMTHVMTISPKVYAKWQASGRPLFKFSADGSSAWIARGKSWDCLDYSAIRVSGGR